MSLAALQTSAVKVKFQSVWNQSIEPAVEHPCLQLSAALGHSNTLLHTLRATIQKVSYDNVHITLAGQHACVLQSNMEYFIAQCAHKTYTFADKLHAGHPKSSETAHA